MKDIDRKFPWSFLGFLAGVVFGGFGIYTVFFYSRIPDLQIDIINEAPVFSVREDVAELEIMFQGNNIRETEQGLSVMTIRMLNQGNAPIRASDFDEKDPLVLRLANGEIIKADFSESSEDYFKSVYADIQKDKKFIQFPSFIMEPGKFMNLQLLILHSRSERPRLSVHGKVANMDALSVNQGPGARKEAVEITVTNGDLRIQILRVLAYGFGTIIAIVAVIGIGVGISNGIRSLRRRKRKDRRWKIVNRYLDELDADTREKVLPFARLIVEDDDYGFNHVLMRHIHAHETSPGGLMKDDHFRMLLRHVEMRSPDFDPRDIELTPGLLRALEGLLRAISHKY